MLVVGRKPVAIGEQIGEPGLDRRARVNGAVGCGDSCTDVGDELPDERRVEHVFVGVERRQARVEMIMKVAHDTPFGRDESRGPGESEEKPDGMEGAGS